VDFAGLRYADCPTVDVEVTIDAPARVVWELVSDVDLPARFSEEFQGARWLDGATGPAVGARFVGTNNHPVVGSWQTTCTVIEYEPERRLTYVVSDPERPAATWRFTVAATNGQTSLRQWARIGPGPSLLNPVIDAQPAQEGRIVAGRLKQLHANMTATLTGIKRLAERFGL
jgi:uncharacterized protein YndB with AHSA1/START domain